jgi:hypothetical protein
VQVRPFAGRVEEGVAGSVRSKRGPADLKPRRLGTRWTSGCLCNGETALVEVNDGFALEFSRRI